MTRRHQRFVAELPASIGLQWVELMGHMATETLFAPVLDLKNWLIQRLGNLT